MTASDHFHGTLIGADGFRSMIVYSAVAHVVAGFVLAFGGLPSRRVDLPQSVMVQLVANPSPAPAKLVRQPLHQPVVIPKREKPQPKPRAEPKPAPVAKPEPKPEPRLSTAELMAQLRQNVQTREGESTAATTETAAPRAGRFDPLLAAYRRKVIALLHTNFSGARACASEPDLRARYEVGIDPGGGVPWMTLTTSSHNRFFVESAERAIRRANFPKPPRGALTLDVTFQPGSVF